MGLFGIEDVGRDNLPIVCRVFTLTLPIFVIM